jgi:hypothetical protein
LEIESVHRQRIREWPLVKGKAEGGKIDS